MTKKSDLLKELGWGEDLICHFMIEDSEFAEIGEPELTAEVYDSHTLTITFRK